MEQLSLDFNSSANTRMKRELKRIKQAAKDLENPTLFDDPISIDISLGKPGFASAYIPKNYDKTLLWLTSIVGPTRVIKKKQVSFPADKLVRLLYVRPPNVVTLDGPSVALARLILGDILNLKPVVVKKNHRRLLAQTPKSWPSRLKIVDAPINTILHLIKLKIKFTVDKEAESLFEKKILDLKTPIASARIAGSMVIISTKAPSLVEKLNLPGLSFLNGKDSGLFKLPLLNSKILLETPQIYLSKNSRKIIRKAALPAKPVQKVPDFPWTLYPFQAVDVGKSLKILETTGGVLMAAEMGSGKALAENTLVVTSRGLLPIKKIKKGDNVQGSDSLFHTVTGVYPQGERDLYRFTLMEYFSGETFYVDSDVEHLWPCLNNKGASLLLTTREILNRLQSEILHIKMLNGRKSKIIKTQNIGIGYAYCISVDSPDNLFVLENEVLSHNTTMSLALTELKQAYPLLVVAPLSAFSTWVRQLDELGKKTFLATGKSSLIWDELTSKKYEAIIISYDRLSMFHEAIADYGFSSIIVDEIQRIRTPSSKRSRILRQIAAHIPNRIGLSGTPLTNRVNDLLPVGSFLVPSEWPARANTKTLEDLYPNDPVEQIAEHLSSIMVRRKMTEVGANLPKRHDHRILVDLTLQQRKALEELENLALVSAREGFFEDTSNRMHAFAKLQNMRQIINTPSLHNVKGGNPKIDYTIDLVQSFINADRKGVVFCADRTSFKEIAERLTAEGIKFVKIWGSTPPLERISAEKTFHTDPETKLVLCTIQAGSESWSASPTATWLISTAYMYAPSILAQMEARVYRMNSDPNGPDIDICYLHASAPNGTLDDRMVEILENKKHLFAKVVDRNVHVDTTKLHYSMNDLMYLLTGSSAEQQPLIGSIDNKNVTRYSRKPTAGTTSGKSKTKTTKAHKDATQDALFSDIELDNLSY